MVTLHRTRAPLIWAALAYLVAACETDAPTEPRAAPAKAQHSLFNNNDDNGGNGGFLLGGTAQLAQDPENPANDVIIIRTDIPPFFGTVSRTVNVKIDKLDNMLEFKAWFETGPPLKTCIGGAPRLQLAIDSDGDGDSDGNVFLDTGVNGSGSGCPQETWLYEDLTGGDGVTGLGLFPSTGFTTPNEERECSASQLGGPGVPGAGVPWSQCETFFLTVFPNHLVCTVALVDDTFFIPGMSGTAYYDLFSAGRATWTDRSDIAGRGFAQGCGQPDDDDDGDDDGDHDHDGDEDEDDDEFDDDRKEQWGSD
jgi:hypothetical protein